MASRTYVPVSVLAAVAAGGIAAANAPALSTAAHHFTSNVATSWTRPALVTPSGATTPAAPGGTVGPNAPGSAGAAKAGSAGTPDGPGSPEGAGMPASPGSPEGAGKPTSSASPGATRGEPGKADPTGQPPGGPDAKGPAAFGLCNAYSHHEADSPALVHATAFRNLAEAAGGPAKIEAYCATVPHPGAPSASEGATGNAATPTPTTSTPTASPTSPVAPTVAPPSSTPTSVPAS